MLRRVLGAEVDAAAQTRVIPKLVAHAARRRLGALIGRQDIPKTQSGPSALRVHSERYGWVGGTASGSGAACSGGNSVWSAGGEPSGCSTTIYVTSPPLY